MNNITIIALAVFLVAIFIIRRFTKQGMWNLSDLKLHDTETVLFEDEVHKFETVFRSERNRLRYIRAKIVVTNERFICAQKMLFAKDAYRIILTVDYTHAGQALHPRDILGLAYGQMKKRKENFLNLFVKKQNIKQVDSHGQQVLELHIEAEKMGSFFKTHPLVRIYTKNLDLYKKHHLV